MSKISVKVRREFLNKETCLSEARSLLSDGSILNMNELQLAREIYFHALTFYFCEKTGCLTGLKAHANPINLHDGGDTLLRRAVYAISWIINDR